MCGICGWFTKQVIPKEVASQKLQKMMQAIQHRGPDGRGQMHWKHAAMGHLRLAIIDLETGQQPLSSPENRFTISFNGEIYNYRELRQQLKQQYDFKTKSDTEVILALYTLHGISGFNRLRGMYAFSIWDELDNKGILVRDPYGIKPLFWSDNKGREFLFASEAKGILSAGHGSTLDENSLHLLMNFRYIPGDRTLFRDINQLPPGGILTWQNGSHKLEKHSPFINFSTEENNTLYCLTDSVQKHLTSDVEVGCYLSGGIDSAAIAAIANPLLDGKLKSFTLETGDDPEEATNAAITAKSYGIQNIQYQLSENITDHLPRLLFHLELPKINAWQNYQLAASTSQHVKVALSGLGGDELYLGYKAHKILHINERLSHYCPHWLSHLAGKSISSITSFTSPLEWSEQQRIGMMLEHLPQWPYVYGLLRNVWDLPGMRQKIYGERMMDASLQNGFELISQDHAWKLPPVAAMADFEFRNKMVNDLLWQEDRVSMAHGLEVRVPFIDILMKHDSQSYSVDQLMPDGKIKSHLRRSLTPLLKPEILNRPKSGFQVNAADFFHQHLSSLSEEWLTQSRISEYGLFNPTFVKQVLSKKPKTLYRWHYFILYFMLMTQMWTQMFEQEQWQQQIK